MCEKDIEELPQTDFEAVKSPLEDFDFPEEVVKDLSTDQRLLLEYVKGISSGRVDSRFAAWKIGPLNHARWLTLAIRLLCLYSRGSYQPDLQEKLQLLVRFIVEVYSLSWFEIKRDSAMHNQQFYLFSMILRIKMQPKEIKFNSFALLPENILYSMVMSEDIDVREAGLKKIRSIRKGKTMGKRINKITNINFEADHWSDLIDLSQRGVCEPAVTCKFSD